MREGGWVLGEDGWIHSLLLSKAIFYKVRNTQEDAMKKGTRLALLLGAIPFLTLVFALPLVNRIHPIILGFPFLLFWILFWVALTPLILFLAYRLEKKYNPPDIGDDL